jgi:hypothetical protein
MPAGDAGAAKETLGQARLQADLQRDMIRTAAVSSWGMLDSARAVVQFSKAAVKSAEIALDGIRQGGPKITSDLCKRRPTPHPNWHLDEVYLKIGGR